MNSTIIPVVSSEIEVHYPPSLLSDSEKYKYACRKESQFLFLITEAENILNGKVGSLAVDATIKIEKKQF